MNKARPCYVLMNLRFHIWFHIFKDLLCSKCSCFGILFNKCQLCTGILQMTTWSLCQTEGPETSLTNYVDAPKHGIHPHNAASSQSLNNKGQLRLHSLGITPLILAAMSKMTNSTPSNDSHSTKYAVFLQKFRLQHWSRDTQARVYSLFTWLSTLGSFKDHCRKYLKWELCYFGVGRCMSDRH